MRIETRLSDGFMDLVQIFFNANELDIRIEKNGQHMVFEYDDNSDTASKIMYMSIIHCGLINMIEDYLIKCGISPSMFSYGKTPIKRDMKQLDNAWEEHRKKIGLRT